MEHHLALWTGLALGVIAGCGDKATIGILPADTHDGGNSQSSTDVTPDAGQGTDDSPMTTPSSGPAPWPMIGQGPAHQSRSVSKMAPSASRRTWELSLGEALYSSPVIAADGTIYAATEHALHAVSASGTQKWAIPIQYPSKEAPSPAIGTDGTVYVKNGNALDAIDPAGKLKWEVQFPSGVLTSPTIAENGTIYIATTDGGSWLYLPTERPRSPSWRPPRLTPNGGGVRTRPRPLPPMGRLCLSRLPRGSGVRRACTPRGS